MIRVDKPDAPRQLKKGEAVTRKDCTAYEAKRVDYENGKIRFDFKPNIYGHSEVRETLIQAHHGKCCFCEGKSFGPFAPGDVEHYRPKGSVRQNEQSSKILPGYFWLAYSWDNLYWCCQFCNRSNKKNLFPLRDPKKRARSHTDDLTQEEPLVLDPGGLADPCEHIGFHKEVAIGLTEVGRNTIKFIGLNRNPLEEARRTRMAELLQLLNIVDMSKGTADARFAKVAEEASFEIEAAVLPTAEFSAMAIELVKENRSSKI